MFTWFEIIKRRKEKKKGEKHYIYWNALCDMGVDRGASPLWEGWGGPWGLERDKRWVGISLGSGESPGGGR